MLLQVLGHAETLDLLSPKDGSHRLVRREPLLVLGVLELVLLQIGPEPLGALRTEIVRSCPDQSNVCCLLLPAV